MPDLADKVTSAKYCWTQSTTQPADSVFTTDHTFITGDTITHNDVTGTYYLWCLLETIDGEKFYCRSEGFNFDNTGPNGQLTSTAVSQNSFELTATAKDAYNQIGKYKFYVNGVLEKEVTTDAEQVSCLVENVSMGKYDCYVIVEDSLGNPSEPIISATEIHTKMHSWEVYDVSVTTKYEQYLYDTTYNGHGSGLFYGFEKVSNVQFNENTGTWSFKRDSIGIELSYRGWSSRTGTTGYAYGQKEIIKVIGSHVSTLEYIDYEIWRSRAVETVDKGIVKEPNNAYDSNRNAYPDNGAKEIDGVKKWYVYKGIL